MAFCGPSKYIFRAIEGYFGHIPGGLPFATVVSCMVYAAITGSTTATIVAIGTIAIPPMIAAGYPKSFCTGLMANSATIGQMIPPSVYMILYGAMVQEDVGVLFISGVIPGLIIGFAMAFLAGYIAVKQKFKLPPRAPEEVRRKALVRGLPAIVMPVIVLGGNLQRDFHPDGGRGDLVRLFLCHRGFLLPGTHLAELQAGGHLFRRGDQHDLHDRRLGDPLCGTVDLRGHPPGDHQHDHRLRDERGRGPGPDRLVWLVFGCFLDPLPIMYLTIPVVLPALKHFNINLVHFNVLCILAMQIAQVTPPFGISLFTVSGVFQDSIPNVIRGAWPYLFLMIALLPLFIWFPWLSTFLPSLIRPMP